MSNRHEVVLDAASIVATAEEEVRHELADEGVWARLIELVGAYRRAGLDDEHASVAAEALTEIVVVRLRLDRDRKRHPGIADERIERPIVLVGFPRSGTTFLHALLAVDPANRAPVWWETMHPSPPPGAAAPDDHRRQLAQREVADYVRRCPGVRVGHPYFVEGSDTIMECESILTFDIRNAYPLALRQIPATVEIDLLGDPHEAYAFHRQFLQALQWKSPRRRWALKGTDHQFLLPALLATYPDAAVVWPHRHPVAVIASLLELTAVLVEGITGAEADRRAIGGAILERLPARLEAAMEDASIDGDNVMHLRYDRFTRDPAGELRTVYDRFGLAFSADFERRIAAWMADERHRPDRYGKFSYTLERAGLEADVVTKRFAAYIDRFDLLPETR